MGSIVAAAGSSAAFAGDKSTNAMPGHATISADTILARACIIEVAELSKAMRRGSPGRPDSGSLREAVRDVHSCTLTITLMTCPTVAVEGVQVTPTPLYQTWSAVIIPRHSPALNI